MNNSFDITGTLAHSGNTLTRLPGLKGLYLTELKTVQKNCGAKEAREISNLPEMISVFELQKHLNISRDLAYNLVRRKDFPSIKLGKEYRVFTEQLPLWLAGQQKRSK